METWLWILGWFVSILTVTGNGFVIFLVYSKRHLRTKTNAFIVSLAVADFLVGIQVFPSRFFLEMIGRSYPQVIDTGLKIILRLMWLFQGVSVLSMCSLVLDRYIAVVKPLKYLTFMTSRRVIQLIFFSWGASAATILLELLLRFVFRLNETLLFYTLKGLVALIFFVFPCVLIFFCFSSMLRVIYRQNRAAHVLGKQLPSNNRREKSALIMMTIVVALFLVYCGAYVRCMIKFWTVQCNEYNKSMAIIISLNSAANPLAYAVFKGDIKKEIKRLFCRATTRWTKGGSEA